MAISLNDAVFIKIQEKRHHRVDRGIQGFRIPVPFRFESAWLDQLDGLFHEYISGRSASIQVNTLIRDLVEVCIIIIFILVLFADIILEDSVISIVIIIGD